MKQETTTKQETVAAKIWPVDFTTLKKGDIIDGPTLAREWGLNLNLATEADKFKLKLLSLCETINRQTRERGLTAQVKKGNIQVLRDGEYAKKQQRLVGSATRKILKAVKLPAPEFANLSQEEVVQWDAGDRFAQRNAAKILEARNETRAIRKALKAGTKRPSMRS